MLFCIFVITFLLYLSLTDEDLTVTELPGLTSTQQPESVADRGAESKLTEAEGVISTGMPIGDTEVQRDPASGSLNGSDALEAAWRIRESLLVQSLKERTEELTRLQKAYHDAVKNQELLTVLAGCSLMPGAAQQLVKLWRDELDCHEENGTIRVTSRDGKSVSEIVNERLRESEYAHFTRSQARGGPTQRGGERQVSLTPAPKTLGESVLMQWQAQQRSGKPGGPAGLARRHY
jgi:hypothetical protein